MKRKLIVILLIFVVLGAIGFMRFYKDKTLRFIPENADFIVLIDVKNASAQYFFSLIKHPSQWFGNSKISLKKNGIKIPDFIQIFHLKNTSFLQWYCVMELSDKIQFLEFIEKKGFKLSKNKIYIKGPISIEVENSKCVFGISNPDFEKTAMAVLQSNRNKKWLSDQLINGSLGSFSYVTDSQVKNFAIDLNEDDLEIKSSSEENSFLPILSNLEKNPFFLEFELDSQNIQNIAWLIKKQPTDSLTIKSISGVVNLEIVNDKIVTYSYDDNFNEVEKVSYQKVVQPTYIASIKTIDGNKTWAYFLKKKWINSQNEFTPIPFQPNIIEKKANVISIHHTRNSLRLKKETGENFIFLKNSTLLANSLKTITKSEKKLLSKIDYLFYGNKAQAYYFKLKFKKEELPIILR